MSVGITKEEADQRAASRGTVRVGDTLYNVSDGVVRRVEVFTGNSFKECWAVFVDGVLCGWIARAGGGISFRCATPKTIFRECASNLDGKETA